MFSDPSARSRAVSSNQTRVHPRLSSVLARHRDKPYQRPQARHAAPGLAQLERLLADARDLVLDSGCGTGESTRQLGLRYPDAIVVGIDKSASRLRRAMGSRDAPSNVHFLRLDCCDCWDYLAAANVSLAAHYLLYPNPWPKQHHLMRRWHAHPIMPRLIRISPQLELRTNWRLYAEEFAVSARYFGARASDIQVLSPVQALSAFEAKYDAAGQALYRVTVEAVSAQSGNSARP